MVELARRGKLMLERMRSWSNVLQDCEYLQQVELCGRSEERDEQARLNVGGGWQDMAESVVP